MTRARVLVRAIASALVIALAVALILAIPAVLVTLLAPLTVLAGYIGMVLLAAVLVFVGSIESSRPVTSPAAPGDEEKPDPDSDPDDD